MPCLSWKYVPPSSKNFVNFSKVSFQYRYNVKEFVSNFTIYNFTKNFLDFKFFLIGKSQMASKGSIIQENLMVLSFDFAREFKPIFVLPKKQLH